MGGRCEDRRRGRGGWRGWRLFLRSWMLIRLGGGEGCWTSRGGYERSMFPSHSMQLYKISILTRCIWPRKQLSAPHNSRPQCRYRRCNGSQPSPSVLPIHHRPNRSPDRPAIHDRGSGEEEWGWDEGRGLGSECVVGLYFGMFRLPFNHVI